MKMLITYKYEGLIRVTELERFKKMKFYTPEMFGKVCIYDFKYIFSHDQELEYKNYIKNMSIRKLKKLNL